MAKATTKSKYPVLKYNTETIHTMDYGDLEDFVRKVYGAEDYSFPVTQECGNDTKHKFSPTGVIRSYDDKEAAAIRGGNVPDYRNDLVFDVLVADGYLPVGKYLVAVCW